MVNLAESARSQSNDDLAASLLQTVEELNSQRANFERISTIVIHGDTWSDQNGFLTPTLKVKRARLDEVYGNQYLEWHESDKSVIWV